jgi:RNA polymerase sigma-70 factor (ECF subfamily)
MSENGAEEQVIARIVAALRGNGPGQGGAQRWAVEQLYQRYAGRIKRYMTRGVTRDEAEVLMHEVFLRVLDQGHTFREDAQRFEAWLWTVARHRLIDAVIAKRRKDGRNVELEIDSEELTDDSIDPEEKARTFEMQDCFERGYAQFKLKFPTRAVALSWLVTDQLGIQDIAEILGRTPGATRQYLSECRQKLRPYVEPCREHLQA